MQDRQLGDPYLTGKLFMQRILSFVSLFRRERRPGDLVFAIAFFVVAVLAALSLPSQVRFMDTNDLVSQPSFWSLVGVLMMLVFGGLHLLSTYNSIRLPGRLREVLLWSRSLEYVLWFIVYVAAVPLVGYLPATILFGVLLSIRLGYRRASMLGWTVVFAAAVVLVFKTGLGVKLPAGEIYAYLPQSIRSFVMVNF